MADERKLKIIVFGLRGIPNVQGGIETHAQMLYPLIVRLGCDIRILQRSPYFKRTARKTSWHGVQLRYLWAPAIPALETAAHSVFSLIYAALKRPDLVHIHGIGPGFLAPLARLLGLRVVVTHHTFDYEREKWGWFAKFIFRLGEYLSMKYSDRRIAVSELIQEHIKNTYDVDAVVIPNGVPRAYRTNTTEVLHHFHITPTKFLLCVARIDRGKRQNDLIDAFEQANTRDWKLVLVGGLDENDIYTKELLKRAAADPMIVMTDFQSGRALREFYSHAGLFVLPSSMEGHPIVLLEAMSYRLPVLATGIPQNRAVPLAPSSYFPVGDTAALAELIENAIMDPGKVMASEEVCDALRRNYSWRQGAKITTSVYRELVDFSRHKQNS